MYLVLDYIHSDTAVFQSTEPTVKAVQCAALLVQAEKFQRSRRSRFEHNTGNTQRRGRTPRL